MSKNYYLTNQSFHLNEHKVRQIVQAELEDFFSCIKDEIENKIKQIDRSIMDLKADLRKIQEANHANFGQIAGKINDLNTKISEIQITRIKQTEKLLDQIKNKALDRSLEKRQDRSPLFRKTHLAPSLDLNNIIFGDESVKAGSNTANVQQRPQQTKVHPISKPPLQKPKNQYKIAKIQALLPVEKLNTKVEQISIPPSPSEEHDLQNADQNSRESNLDDKVKENLNKNKNSFMRKKSLKKFSTIPEEDIQQSLMSTS